MQFLWNCSMGIVYIISLFKHKIPYLGLNKDKPKSKQSRFFRLNKIILLQILNVRASIIWKYSLKLFLPNRRVGIHCKKDSYPFSTSRTSLLSLTLPKIFIVQTDLGFILKKKVLKKKISAASLLCLWMWQSIWERWAKGFLGWL